jgi:hypothetical protein
MRGEHRRISIQKQSVAQAKKDQFIQSQLSERQRLNVRHKVLQHRYRMQQQELSRDMDHYRKNQLERLRTKPKAPEKIKKPNIPTLQKPVTVEHAPINEQTPVNTQNRTDTDRDARRKAFMAKRNNAQQERTQCQIRGPSHER